MDDKQLNEIEARATAATPGIWHEGDVWVYTDPIYEDDNRLSNVLGMSYADPERAVAEHQRGLRNARFIAHAREDVPALLAEVGRLRTALDGAGDHVGHVLRRLTEAEADRDRARDIAVALEQEVARVRALHAKRDVFEVGPDGILGAWRSSGCEACSDPDLIADLEDGELTEELVPWPCATIRAMDGGEAL